MPWLVRPMAERHCWLPFSWAGFLCAQTRFALVFRLFANRYEAYYSMLGRVRQSNGAAWHSLLAVWAV